MLSIVKQPSSRYSKNDAKNDAKTLKRRWIDHLEHQNPNSKNSRDNSHSERQKPKFNL